MLGWEQFSLFYFLLFCIYQHFYVSIYIFIKENFDLFLGRDFRSWLLEETHTNWHVAVMDKGYKG